MTILAAVDVETDQFRPVVVGADLATAFDEPLVALHVISESEFQDKRNARESLPEDFSGDSLTIDQAREDAANEIMRTADDAGLDTSRIDSRGVVGDPAEEILALAAELDPRYIVVGGRQRTPAKQALFGSVSQEIVRKAEQPVVTTMQSE